MAMKLDETNSTLEQRQAWTKGYTHSEQHLKPSLGGLYRGEERFYLDGFNFHREITLQPQYELVPGTLMSLREKEEAVSSSPDVQVRLLPKDEVRTTSSTGGQKGVKPERFSLLPVPALNSVARVYAFGAEKYAAHNWRKGYEWSKSYDSLLRHATQSMNGEDYDEETGEPHLAGVVFHALTLMTYLFEIEQYGHFDDRYKSEFVLDDPNFSEVSAEEAAEFRNSQTPTQVYRKTRDNLKLDDANILMAEYQGVPLTPIEEMIDYLAGMYDNWSVQTATALRRVAKDLRTDNARNVRSFDEFREKFPATNITGLEAMATVNHDIEIETFAPEYEYHSRILSIPQVVGAVYYSADDQHVIGKYALHKSAHVRTVALPGYRFAEGAETEWTFVL